MKKYFLLLIIFLVGCSDDINLPETNIIQQNKMRNFIESHDSICIEARQYLSMVAPYSGISILPGEMFLNGNIHFPYSNFVIDQNGSIIKFNGILANENENYQIISDGKSFTPKRIAMWRGELYEDPEDGISGDEYYNIPTREIRKYIEHENKWIKD